MKQAGREAAELFRGLPSRIIRLPLPAERSPAPSVRDHATRFLRAFVFLIAAGTLVLLFPWTREEHTSTSATDALFTAVSAMSGTFASVDTATHWNFLGELTILLLIQAGGLGFMVGASLVLQALRRGLHSYSLHDAVLIRDGSPALSLSEAVDLSRKILRFTLVVESVGALLLTVRFARDMPLHRAAWQGLFHSVSAFCNAGFDLTGNFRSLVPYQSSVVVNLVIMALIQAGALSYMVWADVARRRRWAWLSFETKLVLVLNAGLILLGAAAFLGSEWHGTLAGLSPGTKLLASAFQSVSARSAGFGTVNLGLLNDFTLFVFVGLMFLGGAPGSTAGGVKLPAAGVVGLAATAAMRGQEEVQLFGRRVPPPVVFRALAVILLMAMAQFGTTLLLVVTEELFGRDEGFLPLLFEATSAVGSVGLSTGITPTLSAAGKLVLCLAMFFGKVGPLTIAFALQRRQQSQRYRFPETTVRIG